VRVLVACEFSGIVREAFRAQGHYALSVDLLESELPGPHYRGDVRDCLGDGWDLMVAFPPCTYLAVSGARWHSGTARQADALDFVAGLLSAPVPRIAVENPVGAVSVYLRQPDQIIQPWMFGHGEMKTTCLWLEGLAPLRPTEIVAGREQRTWREPQRADRWKRRSRTFPGIAAAMAAQWGREDGAETALFPSAPFRHYQPVTMVKGE
jgi:hypothetical protein